MGRRVTIDSNECVACGSCAELCPEVFKLNEEAGHAEVILSVGGPEDCIEEAMTTCPVSCIHWESD